MKWNEICAHIEYWDTSLGEDYSYAEDNPMETLEVAKHNGCLPDLDNMVNIKGIVGHPITWDMYSYIDYHYDGSLMELTGMDLFKLEWLLADYVENGDEVINSDIWADYEYNGRNFYGWHKRVCE